MTTFEYILFFMALIWFISYSIQNYKLKRDNIYVSYQKLVEKLQMSEEEYEEEIEKLHKRINSMGEINDNLRSRLRNWDEA